MRRTALFPAALSLDAAASSPDQTTPTQRLCSAAVLGVSLLISACDKGSAPAPPGAEAQAAGDARRGQQLLTQYQCGSCHAIPDIAASRGVVGPSLEGFGRRSYIAGRIPNTADKLAQWIAAPASLVADTTMPSMGVTPAEARDMAAYLGGLR